MEGSAGCGTKGSAVDEAQKGVPEKVQVLPEQDCPQLGSKAGQQYMRLLPGCGTCSVPCWLESASRGSNVGTGKASFWQASPCGSQTGLWQALSLAGIEQALSRH